MKKFDIYVKKREKLSKILCDFGFSYSQVNKFLRNKDVRVNDVKVTKDDVVDAGQVVSVFSLNDPFSRFKIVYEDENIAVINKGAGVLVEGEDGLEGKTGFIAVHRLDRNTEGLLVMAKTKEAEDELLEAIKDRRIEKRYIAEVIGNPKFNGEKMTAYLLKKSEDSLVEIFPKKVPGSLKIESAFKVLKKGTETSVVEINLLTGRTHQIRAHLAFLGYPILGDGKYGKNQDNKKFKEKKQKLFCYYIKFNGLKNNLKYLNEKSFKILPDWAKSLNL